MTYELTTDAPLTPDTKDYGYLPTNHDKHNMQHYHPVLDGMPNQDSHAEPVLKPEYGMLFEHQGSLLQNLQCKYLFVAIQLPSVKELELMIPHFQDCQNYGFRHLFHPNPLHNNEKLNNELIHQEICFHFHDLYDQWYDDLALIKERIAYKINTLLPAVLPNKVIQKDNYAAVEVNGQILYEEAYYQERNMGYHKCEIVTAIISGLGALGRMVIYSINAWIDNQKTKAMMQGMQALYDNQVIIHDQVKVLRNCTSMMAKTVFTTLQTVCDSLNDTNDRL